MSKPRAGPPEVEVLLRGPGFAAVAKPAGFAVAAERNKPGETPLLDAIAAALASERVLVVHRLDRDTSGVLLVATEPEAHRALSLQFQRRQTDKRYLALVRGGPPPSQPEGEIDAPLELDPAGGGRMRVARGERAREGKPSVTAYRVLERFRGFALLEAHPRTGRQHQIRVHFRHAGLPLAVDPLYGSPDGLYLSELKPGYKPPRDRPEPPILGRVSLHAAALGFADPASGAALRATAPPPADFERALRELRRHRALA